MAFYQQNHYFAGWLNISLILNSLEIKTIEEELEVNLSKKLGRKIRDVKEIHLTKINFAFNIKINEINMKNWLFFISNMYVSI